MQTINIKNAKKILLVEFDMKKYQPSQKLLPFIDAYWRIHNRSSNKVSIPIVPDGCMDIIYKNSELFLVGAMSEGIVVETFPKEYTFGIRFKPAILPHLLNIDSSKYQNKLVPLKNLSSELSDSIEIDRNDETQTVRQLNLLFEEKFTKIQINQKILQLVNLVLQNQGNTAIKDLEKDLNMSERQIERMFKYYIGYSPKKFCNIIRFFTLFKDIVNNEIDSFASKAYELGYCDQPHLNKEFKKFSNFFPSHEIMSVFYNTKD